jgi:hypothetical protein
MRMGWEIWRRLIGTMLVEFKRRFWVLGRNKEILHYRYKKKIELNWNSS